MIWRFVENKQVYSVLFNFICFTFIKYSVIGTLPDDDRKIIDEFIRYPQDFSTARKYIGGYICDHTDEFGQRRITKNYDFGPFPIDLLELDDYSAISFEDFKVIAFQILSQYNESDDDDKEITDSMDNIQRLCKIKDPNSTKLYYLNPPEWKCNELSTFQLSCYLCGFMINRNDGTLTIIQIDDD